MEKIILILAPSMPFALSFPFFLSLYLSWRFLFHQSSLLLARQDKYNVLCFCPRLLYVLLDLPETYRGRRIRSYFDQCYAIDRPESVMRHS